jgi:AcrR family transcriptional regulator
VVKRTTQTRSAAAGPPPADESRRKRAKGVASRERILDAAGAIAGERGYEGTSINLIAERSGLPASSIYWHFKDKDELIAAVIERSFNEARAALSGPVTVPQGASTEQVVRAAMRRVAEAILEFPDFLRLGLMLLLERRPDEPTARRRFLEVRRAGAAWSREACTALFPDLDAEDIEALVAFSFALADGFFVAQEIGEADLSRSFDLLATAILAAADRMRAAKRKPSPSRGATAG